MSQITVMFHDFTVSRRILLAPLSRNLPRFGPRRTLAFPRSGGEGKPSGNLNRLLYSRAAPLWAYRPATLQ